MKVKNFKMSLIGIIVSLACIACGDFEEVLEELDNGNNDGISKDGEMYTFPSEEDKHEGTWLQWPHNYGWDKHHVKRYERIWVEMTAALHNGEKVHIIAYNNNEKQRIEKLLINKGLNMGQIDFFVWRTDDVWVRDNGPIFTYDAKDNLVVQDWKFNGWGNKSEYQNDNAIPKKVGEALNLKVVNVDMVNEGGSVELDGNGTLMAKRSSILNNNRNRGWTQKDAEDYFRKYLGVTNFIWLDGVKGQDITDDHIDGTARFANGNTIVTYSKEDSQPGEYDILKSAKNVDGKRYKIVELPYSYRRIKGYEGSYINYYVGNDVVLVPNYNDPMDEVANAKIQTLYPNRKVVGIVVNELYKDGGMIHCVTQQQPAVK